jgi:hypothetical protein
MDLKSTLGKGRKDKELKPREIGKRLLVVLKNQKPIWSSNYGSFKMNDQVKGSTLIFFVDSFIKLAGSLISFFFSNFGNWSYINLKMFKFWELGDSLILKTFHKKP